MRKPSFTVVTCVLVVLTILAFVQQGLLRFVPPATSNRLVGLSQRFLSSAGHQPIDWHVIDENTFSEARKAGKPVLLVVGISGSKLARDADIAAFGDSNVARFVARSFYCVRIDGYEHPEWLNAILPISRMRIGMFTSFQTWLLDSDAHVLNQIVRTASTPALEMPAYSRGFIQLRNNFDDLKQKRFNTAPIDEQRPDIDVLKTQGDTALPSFSAYIQRLTNACDFKVGGFPKGDAQGLYPNVWRFFTLTGNSKLWKASLDPILLSPMMDLQEGGFFHLSDKPDFSLIEFDKDTRQNGEMMSMLALQGQIDSDQFYRELAKSTFDWLVAQSRRNRMLAANQVDDENRQARSPRLSFPSWRLRSILQSDEKEWAGEQLGLNPLYNAQMVPFIRSRDTLLGTHRTYDTVLGKLRESTADFPEYSDPGYLDVNGHTIARMLEVSRLWGDSIRLEQTKHLLANLDKFRFGETLLHRSDPEATVRGYLGDYLGYADAKLQEYLATGNVNAFQEGLSVLDRAVVSFQGNEPGEYDLSAGPEEMCGFASLCVPEIQDNRGESCTAQIIRLLLAYGRLTSDTDSGKDLLKRAKEATALFANLAAWGGTSAASYYCSAAAVSDDLYAVAVGDKARDLADILYRRIPTRFIAPAVGSMRRDLQKREPGIYLVGRTIEGPFSVEDAAQRMPDTLVTRLHK